MDDHKATRLLERKKSIIHKWRLKKNWKDKKQFVVATEMRQNRNMNNSNQLIKPWLNFPRYCQHYVILTWKDQLQKNSGCYIVGICSRTPLPLLSGLIISRKRTLSKTPWKTTDCRWPLPTPACVLLMIFLDWTSCLYFIKTLKNRLSKIKVRLGWTICFLQSLSLFVFRSCNFIFILCLSKQNPICEGLWAMDKLKY